MGNHAVGAAFIGIAETMIERRLEGETALMILDAAADKSGIRGADAEFDDSLDTSEPVGRLIFEAFAPNGVEDIPRYDELNETDEDYDAFDDLFEATFGEFRKRYKLC